MKRNANGNLAIFCLLVALGVLGRWIGAKNDWLGVSPNFTPIAAIGLFAGFYFARRSIALLVPLTAMAISNLWLESYGSWLVMATVYGSFMLAPLLGRELRLRPAAVKVVVAAVLPSLFFFLTTNFAHWLIDSRAPHDLAGLADCYAAAIPFFRWMLEGDLLYSGILFGVYALAMGGWPRRMVRQRVPSPKSRRFP